MSDRIMAVKQSSAAHEPFVRGVIEELRRKLLDLTARNPLISFKHSAKSRRFIRVIDELPNQLFDKFEKDVGLRFRSVGDDSDEPKDEKTILFRRALDAAKLEDPEYLEKIKSLGDEPGEKSFWQAEEDLRIRLRARLGMPLRRPSGGSSAAEAAKRMGLDPSFDLPRSTGNSTASKHADSIIQTLLFDEALERTLATIRDQVRLSIDESGVNPLFCVFGFLEWYEDANSSTPLFAPLMVYPLIVERELVRGHYQYTVRSTGEDPSTNVALRERLKRDFQIVLPELGEDETPDDYLDKVHTIIEKMKGWKVRRWITVGLFSFARIAMYHDLDPEKWQRKQPIERHRSIGRLLGGSGGDDSGGGVSAAPPGEEEESSASEIDRVEMDIPLIADADSSQLLAIRDALAGRDLVIAGPPGTGKSQTITNLIAASLHAGKSVLFLAEKMAALNVVKDRMADAGLGEFCLELHSTKSGKKEVAQSIGKRLAIAPPKNVEVSFESLQKNIGLTRSQLGRVVEALGQPAGALGMTAQQLLWKCHRVRQETAGLSDELDEILHSGADRLTETDLDRTLSTVSQFERVRAGIVRTHGSVQQHPWRGVAAPDLDFVRAGDVVRRVHSLARAAGNAGESLNKLIVLTGWNDAGPRDLRWVGVLAKVEPLQTATNASCIAQLADSRKLAIVEHFVENVELHRQLDQDTLLAFVSPDARNACEPSRLSECLVSHCDVGHAANCKVVDLSAHAERRIKEADLWEATAELLAQITKKINIPAADTMDRDRALVTLVELAALAGTPVLSHRTETNTKAGATDVLRTGLEAQRRLRKNRDSLQSQFRVEAEHNSAHLRLHATGLREAFAIPAFSPRWWRGRAAFQGICRGPMKASRFQAANALDSLAGYVDERDAFAKSPDLTAVVGSKFNGLDAKLDAELRAAEWADEVRRRLPDVDDINGWVQRLLLSGESETLAALATLGSHRRFADLRKAVEGEARAGTVADRSQMARTRAVAAQAAANLAKEVGLKPDFSISEACWLAGALLELRNVSETIEGARGAQEVLGGEFRGRSTDTASVKHGICFVRAVNACDPPPSLRTWLLSTSVHDNHAQLQRLQPECDQALTALTKAISTLQEACSVDFKTWIGEANPLDVVPSELKDHSERCASDPDGLNALVDDARLQNEVRNEGLGAVLDLVEAKKLSFDRLGGAARRVVYQSIARTIIAKSPALAQFTGERHEGHRTDFRNLDRKLMRLRQTQTAWHVSRRHADPGSDVGPKSTWTGLSLVYNEVAKQKRHIHLRDFLDRSGSAIQQLMPCFMMSPLSVAQHLKPGGMEFDLVIMDEASQIRPEDAIGAMSRAKQVIIVGDQMQLPPTNFFMGSDSTDSDDEPTPTSVQEQSILDLAVPVLRPERGLKWHYRSRHPSLIAFSNKEFYKNGLVVFPTPMHTNTDFGVRYVHVPEGQYRAGVNPPEALRVAAEAVKYIALHPERSLGVVASNKQQAELISLELDRLATENPAFEEWRKSKEGTLERFFVKNLENVQGDERDVIFISTVYGRDEQGIMAQRFGPINNEGGHRRLNVLFSRAKCQTVVFSTMDPGDIRAEEISSWGARALKGFLQYAKTGVLDIAEVTIRPPDSDFEVAVAEVLKGAGFDVVPQVGVVGYFVDIGVRHPKRPGEFVLGIECDGAMYHSSKSARDRDRLRQENLERLKWRIHRIWSLDWYRNNKNEVQRLIRAVQAAVGAE